MNEPTTTLPLEPNTPLGRLKPSTHFWVYNKHYVFDRKLPDKKVVATPFHGSDSNIILDMDLEVREIPENRVKAYDSYEKERNEYYWTKQGEEDAEIALKKANAVLNPKDITAFRKWMEKRPTGILDKEKVIDLILPKALDFMKQNLRERAIRECYEHKRFKISRKVNIKDLEKLSSGAAIEHAKEILPQILANQFDDRFEQLRLPMTGRLQMLISTKKICDELESKERNRLLLLREDFQRFLSKTVPQVGNRATNEVKEATTFTELLDALRKAANVSSVDEHSFRGILYQHCLRWIFNRIENFEGDAGKENRKMLKDSYDTKKRNVTITTRRGQISSMQSPFDELAERVQKHELVSDFRSFENDETLQRALEHYTTNNLWKLQQALDKHITDEMVVNAGPHFKEGGKGLEVTATLSTPEGTRYFDARAIIAGGPIISYHARYISHLKKMP